MSGLVRHGSMAFVIEGIEISERMRRGRNNSKEI